MIIRVDTTNNQSGESRAFLVPQGRPLGGDDDSAPFWNCENARERQIRLEGTSPARRAGITEMLEKGPTRRARRRALHIRVFMVFG